MAPGVSATTAQTILPRTSALSISPLHTGNGSLPPEYQLTRTVPPDSYLDPEFGMQIPTQEELAAFEEFLRKMTNFWYLEALLAEIEHQQALNQGLPSGTMRAPNGISYRQPPGWQGGNPFASTELKSQPRTHDPAYEAKLEEIAGKLQMNPNHLRAIINFESGGDPAKRNMAGSGATGLIQFMPKTAERLGTTTEALAQMSAVDQLDYVYKYLAPYAGKLNTLKDAYMAVLYPAAIGKDAGHVLFSAGTKAYDQNRGLDRDGKGYVTVQDATQRVASKG